MLTLLRLKCKQKKFLKFVSNSHISLSFLLIWNWDDVRSSSVVPSKTIPDSRPKWAKRIPIFRPKRRKNPTRWGGIYLCSLYKGVPPFPPGELNQIRTFEGSITLRYSLCFYLKNWGNQFLGHVLIYVQWTPLLNCFFSAQVKRVWKIYDIGYVQKTFRKGS